MIRSLILLALIGCTGAQYVQQRPQISNVQAAQPEQVDQIPAWYQMAKPINTASRASPIQQASPSYYERIEPSPYETRREQPTYERPGIQTNQYANYPSFQNRQPYENLNALTAGASLNNLQGSRRYPNSQASSSGASGQDVPYDSAVKRYHKLLLKRRQWTTMIPRIIATVTPNTTTKKTTTRRVTPTTTKKMPKSLKNIYSTIIPKRKEERKTEESTTPTTTRRILATKKTRATFRPYGTRKGWRMWKKVNENRKTTRPIVSTTEIPTTTSATSTSTTSTTEHPVTTTTVENTTPTTTTTETTSQPPKTTPQEEKTTTNETTTKTTTVESTTENDVESKTHRYICQHKSGSNDKNNPFAEWHRKSTIGPFRPIIIGSALHKWKPLRFKKPEPEPETTTSAVTTSPKGLRILEYLLKQTDIFSQGLKKAMEGPNTELLAAIKDVVAKFKASLDEAGIDQDVRMMGSQLRNTWQQLRTGIDRGMKAVRQSAENSMTNFNYGNQNSAYQTVQHHQQQRQYQNQPMNVYPPGPMNEQLGRLFEKAAADAADKQAGQTPVQSAPRPIQ